jgi:hypothetical protein
LTQGGASKRSARKSRTVCFISFKSGNGGKSIFVSSAILGLIQHYGQATCNAAAFALHAKPVEDAVTIVNTKTGRRCQPPGDTEGNDSVLETERVASLGWVGFGVRWGASFRSVVGNWQRINRFRNYSMTTVKSQ